MHDIIISIKYYVLPFYKCNNCLQNELNYASSCAAGTPIDQQSGFVTSNQILGKPSFFFQDKITITSGHVWLVVKIN